MNYFSKLKQLLPGNINVGKTLQETFGSIANIISGEKNADLNQRQFVLNSLVFEILQQNGTIVPARQAVYRRLLEDRFDHGFAEKCINQLREHNHLPLADAVSELKNWEPNQRRWMIEFLLSLAVAVAENLFLALLPAMILLGMLSCIRIFLRSGHRLLLLICFILLFALSLPAALTVLSVMGAGSVIWQAIRRKIHFDRDVE